MGESGRRNRALELGVVLLISELFKLGFDSIPPVTLLTIIAQAGLYAGLVDVPWSRYDACISGYKVMSRGDKRCLLVSTFEHGDDMHLYYNMISFLLKGSSLERRHGSPGFALILLYLCIATPLFYVLLAVTGSSLLQDKDIMKSCAIGFSGVVFGLKVLTTVGGGGYTSVGGFRVPVRYSAWAELLAIHFLVPNSSFMGHLAGILAALLYLYTPIGSLLDTLIYFITGRRMIHRGWSQDEPSRGNGSWWREESTNQGYNPRWDHRDYGPSWDHRDYGPSWDHREYGSGWENRDYGPRWGHRDYRTGPSAPPPGWSYR